MPKMHRPMIISKYVQFIIAIDAWEGILEEGEIHGRVEYSKCNQRWRRKFGGNNVNGRGGGGVMYKLMEAKMDGMNADAIGMDAIAELGLGADGNGSNLGQ